MNSFSPIWSILEASNDYRSFHVENYAESIVLRNVLRANKRCLPDWKPIKVSLYESPEENEEVKPLGDFVGMADTAISHKAKLVLEGLIDNTVEFLPLDFGPEKYYVLNVDWVDCLDTVHSEVECFRSGRIMKVLRYAFKWDKLENIHMFYITDLRNSTLFVSDLFKKKVEAERLTGLIFYPVPLVEE